MLGDLGILIPEVLADVPDSSRMGDAESIPCVLALGRGMCVHCCAGCRRGGGVLVPRGDA